MAPSPKRGQTSPFVLLALALGTGFAVSSIALPDSASPNESAGTCVGSECGGVEVPPEAPALASSATCPAAGYLCAQLSESPTFRIHRWATDRPPLRVRVDLPDHEDPARARELRRAAVRGIQAWQGRPFPLSIEDRDGVQSGREADVHVTWAPRLDGTALGATHTRWEQGPEGATFTSVRVVLATIHPFSGQILLGPDDVELVAAHEMGHALGLPHSDLPRDLMYPTNTALRPSARDYRTLKALYDLPNGATVVTNGRSVADD